MTLLLGFSAVNTGNNLLYFIVAALLAFMAVSGLAGWLNIRGLRADVRLPDEIYRNRPVTAFVEIGNDKRVLPSLLLEVRLMGATALLHAVPCRDVDARSVTVSFPNRGDVTVSGLTLASRFPINFFVRSTTLPLSLNLTVFPEPRFVMPSHVHDKAATGYALAGAAAGQGGEVRRIGDYTGREPLRQVHWRLSARHDELKVKEFDALSAPPVVIDLDALPGVGLEERLAGAVFQVNRLSREGRAVGLRLGERLVPPGTGRCHRLRLLRELARHGQV